MGQPIIVFLSFSTFTARGTNLRPPGDNSRNKDANSCFHVHAFLISHRHILSSTDNISAALVTIKFVTCVYSEALINQKIHVDLDFLHNKDNKSNASTNFNFTSKYESLKHKMP